MFTYFRLTREKFFRGGESIQPEVTGQVRNVGTVLQVYKTLKKLGMAWANKRKIVMEGAKRLNFCELCWENQRE